MLFQPIFFVQKYFETIVSKLEKFSLKRLLSVERNIVFINMARDVIGYPYSKVRERLPNMDYSIVEKLENFKKLILW